MTRDRQEENEHAAMAHAAKDPIAKDPLAWEEVRTEHITAWLLTGRKGVV